MYHNKFTDAKYSAFQDRTVSIWNSMDSYLRTLKSVSAFKFNMKRKVLKDFINIFSLGPWSTFLQVQSYFLFLCLFKFQLFSLKSLLRESQ